METGIADLEWYLGRHPKDPVGHYQLGLAYSTSDPTKGIANLEQALALKPDYIEARAARGALYYLQGNPEAGLPDLEAAAAAQPSNGMILDRLGQTYRALDRLPDAIRTLRKAAELAPGEATVILHLGNALAEAGESKEAELLMDRYRQMRPAQAPRNLMSYLSLTPEQQRADYRRRVEKAVVDHPTDVIAQLHYLKLSLEENQFEQAAATARAILELQPGAAVLADGGRALLEARQYGLAKDFLERADAANPNGALQLDLAVAAFRTLGPAEGLRRLEGLEPSRRNVDYHLARAQMLGAAERFGEAISALDQAIRLSPARADLYWQQAVFLHRAGRPADAVLLLDGAEKILPQDPQIPLVKVALLELTGHADEAGRLIDQVQRRWPEAPPVWVARALIQAAHQRDAEARKSFETAAALGARTPATTEPSALRLLFEARPPKDW
jgi:tetratricopeptide (TPR) repeat protein